MDSDLKKPRLLVVSHVYPVDTKSGQELRVRNKLIAFRNQFHVTFLTVAVPERINEISEAISEYVDDIVVLPSLHNRSRLSRVWHGALGRLYSCFTGLKPSNYSLGLVEFASDRIEKSLAGREFDLVVFEYWHAFRCAGSFRRRGIPTVLDMHNVLWRGQERNLRAARLPEWWVHWVVRRYRKAEEQAWERYDGLIAINRNEMDYVAKRLLSHQKLFYAPMGIDLRQWPVYSRLRSVPPRFAYYGGLGSRHNVEDALRCVREIMPLVWDEIPEAEVWLVGSNPPDSIQELTADSRVKVTGFVEDVASVLGEMTAVFCPWRGCYGFRSRVVEVMALGVPVIATSDAVDGMELRDGDGLYLRRENSEFAASAIALVQDHKLSGEVSERARSSVERLYSFESTYGRLSAELLQLIGD